MPLDLTARRWFVVGALGVNQILAWGSSYYLITVLAEPVAAGTGWGLTWIVGGFTIGLLAAGMVSPLVGREIDRRGGRPVLALGAALIAAGQAGLGLAPGLPFYLAAWVVLGVGMGAGLYDAAFAALGRLYGQHSRGAITALTLYGGFASTVCWPLSVLLTETVGWRGTCLVYSAVNLLIVLPLAFALPREERRELPSKTAPADDSVDAPGAPARHGAFVYVMLALCMTLSGVI